MSEPGMATLDLGQSSAWHSVAQLGMVQRGVAWSGTAQLHVPWHGLAQGRLWHNMGQVSQAWPALACHTGCSTAKPSMDLAWHGKAWHSPGWHSLARHSSAWHGCAQPSWTGWHNLTPCSWAWPGSWAWLPAALPACCCCYQTLGTFSSSLLPTGSRVPWGLFPGLPVSWGHG